jgi:hypothetical protein
LSDAAVGKGEGNVRACVRASKRKEKKNCGEGADRRRKEEGGRKYEPLTREGDGLASNESIDTYESPHTHTHTHITHITPC